MITPPNAIKVSCCVLRVNQTLTGAQNATCILVDHRPDRCDANAPATALDLSEAQTLEQLTSTPWGWMCADGEIEVLDLSADMALELAPDVIMRGVSVYQLEDWFTPGLNALPDPFVKLQHPCSATLGSKN